MTTETGKLRIDAEVWEADGLVARFSWEPGDWEVAARVDCRDGAAALWLHLEGARELHRALGEALDKQDHADAGHPDEEQLMAEAEARGAAVENR